MAKIRKVARVTPESIANLQRIAAGRPIKLLFGFEIGDEFYDASAEVEILGGVEITELAIGVEVDDPSVPEPEPVNEPPKVKPPVALIIDGGNDIIA